MSAMKRIGAQVRMPASMWSQSEPRRRSRRRVAIGPRLQRPSLGRCSCSGWPSMSIDGQYRRAPARTGLGSRPHLDGELRRAGSRRAPRGRPRAGARRARACRAAAGARSPGRRSARASGVPALRSHQAKTSTAAAVEATATPAPATGPGFSITLPHEQRAGDVGGQQRRDEVRAAAVVLLGGVGRVGVLVGRLVGGDRLVLDAVVGGQLAAAQGEHGGRERERRGRRLADRAGAGGGAAARR